MISLFVSGCNTPSVSMPSFGGKKVKKEYFTGGGLRSEFIMNDATGQNGVKKTYGYDGHMNSIVKIKNGVRDGIETWLDEKGRVIMRVPYVNGKKEGVQEAYYPNGDVMRRTAYKNGLLHGKAIIYRKDGSIHKQNTFRFGKMVN